MPTTVHYRIDYPRINFLARDKAFKLMKLVVAEAKITAQRNVSWGPYTRTQRLKDSIYGTLRSTPEGFVGQVGSHLSYAASVEGGARAHIIRPRTPDGWLAFYWERGGRYVVTKRVSHPGQRGKHYLRDALLRTAKRRNFRVTIY